MFSDDPRFEESGDELKEHEFPDDQFDDEWNETIACPQCGAEVYEDADYCPACDTYITPRSHTWSGRPTWWIVLGLLGILATILVLARFPAW